MFGNFEDRTVHFSCTSSSKVSEIFAFYFPDFQMLILSSCSLVPYISFSLSVPLGCMLI
jgi:hypothetical protein